MSKFFKKNLFLLVTLAFAFFLRTYQINVNPPALNWDEISHGYNAYSILKTGADEWGIKFPLIFRAYGDYKLPLYIYLTVFPVKIFGLTLFSVRLISILSGVGLVLLAYLFTKKITRKESVSLFAGFLTAVSPWSLFLSRVAVEANLGAFLFALGFYFLFFWLEQPKTIFLFFAFFTWGLSLHAYNSARVLVPIFFLIISWLLIKKRKFNQLLVPAFCLLIFAVPVLFQFFDKSANARFNWVSLIDQGAVQRINELRSQSFLPMPLPKLVFNKPLYFVSTAIKNYFANFSLKYLFVRGGSHYQFSLPEHELLYLVTAPFLILGLLLGVFRGSSKERLLVLWFLVSFLPSAITRDAPHVLRSIFVLPAPMIFSALGLMAVGRFLERSSKLKGRLVGLVLLLAVSFSFWRWWNDYFSIYQKYYSWAWQYGYKEAVSFAKENYAKYDKIIVTKRYGEPHEFFLFYFPWDPQKYQTDKSKIWDYHANWYWVDGFDKFQFLNDWEVIKILNSKKQIAKSLLITSPGNYPEGWSKIKTINFLDGKPAFEILEK